MQSGVGTSVATSSLPWLALRRTAFAGDPAVAAMTAAVAAASCVDTREVKVRRKVFRQIATVEAKMLIPPSGTCER